SGLAAGVLIGLRDRVDRQLAADFTTAGASHVVAISGWNIAIVASTLAAVAGGLARRRRAALTILAILAYVLFVDPTYIGDAGFRLSVLATAGILAWGSSLTDRIAGADPGRPRRWLADILGVSLAAQAATTPIVLLDFGRLSLVAPAVNLLVVPLVPPAMALGALAMTAGVVV